MENEIIMKKLGLSNVDKYIRKRTSCSKNNCNLPSKTYVSEVGYICNECKEEFKNYLAHKGIVVTNTREATEYLKVFMEISKGFFNEETNFDLDKFLE